MAGERAAAEAQVEVVVGEGGWGWERWKAFGRVRIRFPGDHRLGCQVESQAINLKVRKHCPTLID